MKKILFILSALCICAAAQAQIYNTAAGTTINRSADKPLGFFGTLPVVQQSGTAALASTLASYGLINSGASGLPLGNGIYILTGTASPVGVTAANAGVLFLHTTGSSAFLYLKASGTGTLGSGTSGWLTLTGT